jgi:hypothetical protein
MTVTGVNFFILHEQLYLESLPICHFELIPSSRVETNQALDFLTYLINSLFFSVELMSTAGRINILDAR